MIDDDGFEPEPDDFDDMDCQARRARIENVREEFDNAALQLEANALELRTRVRRVRRYRDWSKTTLILFSMAVAILNVIATTTSSTEGGDGYSFAAAIVAIVASAFASFDAFKNFSGRLATDERLYTSFDAIHERHQFYWRAHVDGQRALRRDFENAKAVVRSLLRETETATQQVFAREKKDGEPQKSAEAAPPAPAPSAGGD